MGAQQEGSAQGWAVCDSLKAEGPLAALEMASRALKPGAKPVAHSDRSFQESPEGLIEFYYLPDEFLEQFPQPKSVPVPPTTPAVEKPQPAAATPTVPSKVKPAIPTPSVIGYTVLEPSTLITWAWADRPNSASAVVASTDLVTD